MFSYSEIQTLNKILKQRKQKPTFHDIIMGICGTNQSQLIKLKRAAKFNIEIKFFWKYPFQKVTKIVWKIDKKLLYW